MGTNELNFESAAKLFLKTMTNIRSHLKIIIKKKAKDFIIESTDKKLLSINPKHDIIQNLHKFKSNKKPNELNLSELNLIHQVQKNPRNNNEKIPTIRIPLM